MTFTKTHTLTQKEKFILTCFEEASKEEIPARAIIDRAREAEEYEMLPFRFSEELLLTCLGQLVERGLVLRIEHDLGEFCYRRA